MTHLFLGVQIRPAFKRYTFATLALTALLFIIEGTASAQPHEKVLAVLANTGADGGLVFDKQGNLYGTTVGFDVDFGKVFKLQHNPDGTWTNILLYQFSGGTDGAYPHAGLIFDREGNLYGTTSAGGTNSCPFQSQEPFCGTVFKLTPTADGQWQETVLYNFSGGTDGANPSAGVISDNQGNLYGTTAFGGLSHGTVFELSPGSNGSWTEQVLYRFTGGADGNGPGGGLALDRTGNLYGTTIVGGNSGDGTIFELSPGASWTFQSLYSFCSQASCSDGANPAGVIVDSRGNLYGTANRGGIVPCWWLASSQGCGTFYRLSRETNFFRFELLYSFCSLSGCPDGALPSGPLVFDRDGSLYGVASVGGTFLGGTVFKLSHRAPKTADWTADLTAGAWNLEPLYSFCALANCDDGLNPSGKLVLDRAGNLYGTTPVGANGNGVAFEIVRFPKRK